MMKRILICANPDLNYIDGSSIWAQTITLIMSEFDGTVVDFLAKSTPRRDELFTPLRQKENINIIDGTKQSYWNSKPVRALTPNQMADFATRLDEKNKYDIVVVRGFELAKELYNSDELLRQVWLYLTDIPQTLSDINEKQKAVLKSLSDKVGKVLYQSQLFGELWQQINPQINSSKLLQYSPVVQDSPDGLLPASSRKAVAVYAGKFKAEWKTLEMAKLWPRISKQVPTAEFRVIGDKIHDEPCQPTFKNEMQHALEHTVGLTWLGAKSRELVFEELQTARVGLSWRCETLDDIAEYSTKLLEYGAAGCAAIVNRNPLHEELLGSDYPLFANSEQEYTDRLTESLSNDDIVDTAAERTKHLAASHSFSARVGEMNKTAEDFTKKSKRKRKLCVLVAGHDLKFFSGIKKRLLETSEFEFIEDKWLGHNKHNEQKSSQLLKEADVIFCEWCLGNVKWYSNHKHAHQKLIARFHAQEIKVPYMKEANWNAIDHVIFVSEHTREAALDNLNSFPLHKTSVVPNYIDPDKFFPKKKTGDAPFTLGMIGITPMSKRLDRAVELLESLLKKDKRYTLRIKGKNPLSYEWLTKRESERRYYEEIFRRINSSAEFRNKVIFDPMGDDINEWFQMVGWILSPSDHESFHMAVGEGLATGSRAILWDWSGAREIWNEACFLEDYEDIEELFNKCEERENSYSYFGIKCSRTIIENFYSLFIKF